jgi:hypothetical protein
MLVLAKEGTHAWMMLIKKEIKETEEQERKNSETEGADLNEERSHDDDGLSGCEC